MISRRAMLAAGGAAGVAAALPLSALAAERKPLQMPPLVDATATGGFDLTAQAGQTNFLGKRASATWGYSQSYLGPTVRIPARGDTQARVTNTLKEEISVHWHGLIIPGDVDGGPHQPVAPGGLWEPLLPVDQPPATLWYHSHIHGETGRQVYSGLAGVLQLSDGRDDERGLPVDYGVDDLTLVLQDRRFDRRGRMEYDLSMQDGMMGFLGDRMVINGQVGATAVVPRGIVRLRLLNGSNARIYDLTLSDSRPLHLIGTDSGLLDKPLMLDGLTLAPAQRAEVLVDFGSGGEVSLMSGQNRNMGMMGGNRVASGPPFEVLPFAVDETRTASISTLPDDVGGSRPALSPDGANPREIALEMRMGPGMMLRGSANRFSINGKPFDMGRTDQTIALGTTELWRVSANMMMHPFHVHGVAFQVLSENGGAPRPWNTGWKDTILIDGYADLLIPFGRGATADKPFMYHCHILEHEDGGMMGQFAVT